MDEGNKNGAVIINSLLLKKEVREKLGIDRKLLTIPKEFGLRKAFLESFNDITVETFKNSQLLITFPKEKIGLITQVANSWELVKKENKELIKSISSHERGLR
jgi:hypothetical protein